MKQHITVKQLNELSEKGKERLRKWWKLKEGDWCVAEKDDVPILLGDTGMARFGFQGNCFSVSFIKHHEWKHYPLLSIGQLIEFLDQFDNVFSGKFDLGHALCGSCGLDYDDGIDYGSIDVENLCDDLWEACKKGLEK